MFSTVNFEALIAHHKVSAGLVHHCGLCVETYFALQSVEIAITRLIVLLFFLPFLLNFEQSLLLLYHLKWFIIPKVIWP